MELFLPSILIFLLAAIVVVVLIPQFSPIIIVTLAIVLLVAGMYNHFSMFWDEYKQSTWQQSLTLFAPGIIIIAIFVYLFFAIGAFFTGGKVPVPVMPDVSTIPSAETATNALTSSINDTMNATKDLLGLNTAKNESKPNESKPNERKPNESKPNESKPNESKPNNNGARRLLRGPPTKNNNSTPNNSITRSQLAAI